MLPATTGAGLPVLRRVAAALLLTSVAGAGGVLAAAVVGRPTDAPTSALPPGLLAEAVPGNAAAPGGPGAEAPLTGSTGTGVIATRGADASRPGGTGPLPAGGPGAASSAVPGSSGVSSSGTSPVTPAGSPPGGTPGGPGRPGTSVPSGEPVSGPDRRPPAPGTSGPGAPAPGTSGPGTPGPGTPGPGPSAPGTGGPGTGGPGTPDPGTPAPGTGTPAPAPRPGGSVTSDPAGALFAVPVLVPGQREARCVRLSWTGDLPAEVGVTVAATGALAPHLRVVVERGTLPDGGSCDALAVTGTAWDGALSALSAAGRRPVAPLPASSVVVRVTTSLLPGAPQGAAASADVTWDVSGA